MLRPSSELRDRLRQTLRIDRALRLVWEAGPGWTIATAALLVARGSIPVAALYLIKLIIDSIVSIAAGRGEPAQALVLVAVAAAVAVVAAALGSVAAAIQEAHGRAVTDHVQDILHRQATRVDIASYEDPRYHDTLHRALQEAPYRPAMVLEQLASLGHSAIALVSVAVLLAISFHWWFVVALVSAGAPAILLRLRHSRRVFEWHRSRTATERRSHYLNLLLTGSWYAKEVRVLGLSGLLRGRSSALRAQLRSERGRISARKTKIDLVVQVGQTITLFAAFAYAVMRAVDGHGTPGDVVLLYQAFQRGETYLNQILASLASLYENNLFLAYLDEFLSLEPTVVAPPVPRVPPQRVRQGISVESVRFRYGSARAQALDGIDLVVRPGEVIAITGDNGAGKSTLVRLLCRLYDPTAGAIRIDGVDLRDMDPAKLHERLAVVFQDPIGYYVSARENVWFGDVGMPPESPRIIEAAEKIGADRFVSALPRGYDTVLGTWFEDGAELSIGQWKRLALARALVKDAQVLLLDEPTAGVDAEGEARLLAEIEKRPGGRLVVMVSHRITTVSRADRIYVLEKGRVIQTGTHRDLVSVPGAYNRLWEVQSAGREESGCASAAEPAVVAVPSGRGRE